MKVKLPMSKDMSNKNQPIDPDFVREIAALISETDLTEIEVEKGDLRIRVARQVTVQAAPMQQFVSAPAPAARPGAGAPRS
jgi:acetyl-CoA carboxylase biotin carboxyl carrier protein